MAVDYLITGGAGFIGSNLTAHLLRHGATVRVLDNFLTGRPENLEGVMGGLEVIHGDIRDMTTVRGAVTGARYVLHVAALPSVPRSVAEPVLSHDINVTGTLNVLVAARDAGCHRVIFSSSSSVYGDTPRLPKDETMPPAPMSPYAAQKLAGEYYAQLFWSLYGLETVSLRYFNVFGPRQRPDSDYAAVIPRFITRILKGQSPTVFGDGSQSRDFTFIQNVVEANVAACAAPVESCGQAYNIACGDRITLLELIAAINEQAGVSVPPTFAPARPGDILHSQADSALARSWLGWTPRVSFRDGLAQTIAWHRQRL